MVLHDSLEFRISGDTLFVNTPQSGIDVNTFLNVMRRSLNTWRSERERVPALTPKQLRDSCAYPKPEEECTS